MAVAVEAGLIEPLRQRLQIGRRRGERPEPLCRLQPAIGERTPQLLGTKHGRRSAKLAQDIAGEPLDISLAPARSEGASKRAAAQTPALGPVWPATSGLKPKSAASSSHSMAPPPTASQVCRPAASRPCENGRPAKNAKAGLKPAWRHAPP